MCSDISLEERVPAARPLRKLRAVVDALLATMSSAFEAVYACRSGGLISSKSTARAASMHTFSMAC